ncbi:UDP-N-acetylmuramoyl-tripeptide--D-alanyl-D-alanine ligase [Thermolongibacillus altinsuensis]|jgi:UDP-N-acetylmuramoyl-tripeptide--D-alanyl-D-alanine ligase|uniref:UDP-N-acetylmuramoyl-tripeptide--D-alanyl-D-alanine ligase n=1 Tax=Thermolongibacillus altinsuensis TaxID=575256 RepID=A0A4R1QEK0_9BACL|nr:UDP-N-acetylmuramoyl-tripeptide--D-alanyl-D-alanine ligase [Thermolongibacillus altinsuensis]TCL45934.1 UDP-N-acetylmuramoyl-tripeptide--D-alanyl-D-alanine ligase [Thermolongibacillus altinsuensis]
MITRSLVEIQNMVQGFGLDEAYESVFIHGVSTDTRAIAEGNLFVPLKGEKFNGHQFVMDAFNKGAKAALWSKDEPNAPTGVPLIFVDDTLKALQRLASRYREQLNIRVIGVTGSNGKTTTKDMIASLLATTYKVQKTEGNLNNHIGVPLTLLRLEEDTEYAVVEMGMSNFGEIELLSKLAKPDVAVITNIGEAHLQELGSRDGIAQAKFEIVQGLHQNGLFVYNGDEPLLTKRVQSMKLENVRTFGKEKTNDYYPLSVSMNAEGTTFVVNEAPNVSLLMPLLGRHHVYNALAAIAVARHFQLDWQAIADGLRNVSVTKMRTEITKQANGLTIINDAYNASPTSMKAAIQLLEELTGYEKKIAVLGDMLELGEQEVQFHEEIGQMLKPTKIDYVFTYGRLAQHIAKAAADRFPSGRVNAYDDKEALARDLASIASSNDVILLKASRGMKLEEIVNFLC